jgi:4-amino-4-deoxy-L-arabinose transferase-like glycosyltransferase
VATRPNTAAISRRAPPTFVLLAVIFGAALGVRLAYLASDPHPRQVSLVEGEMAHNIVAHGRWFEINERAALIVARRADDRTIDPGASGYQGLDDNPLWRPEVGQPVGSAAILAGLWQFTSGERYLPLQILQALVDAFMAIVVYWVTLHLFKRRLAATAAGLIYALYPPLAFETTIPYTDIWAADFAVAIAALYLKADLSTHRWRWLVACGLTTGIGLYFRPNLLILPVAMALVGTFRAGWRESLRKVITIVALACLLLVPWTIRNFNDFHAFTPTRTGVGQTLWEGLGELHNNFGAVRNNGATAAEVHRTHPGLVVESPAYDNVLLGWAIRAIVHHPFHYAELLAYRTAQAAWLYEPEWMSAPSTPLAYNGGPAAFVIHKPLSLIEDALDPMILLAAGLTLALTWRRWRQEHAMLIAIALATLVPYILILVQPRYVLPAEFVYFIWVGLGIDVLGHQLLSRLQSHGSSARVVRPSRSGVFVRAARRV